jgi:hypothetical protein
MLDANLPTDLVEFLRTGRRLEYDPSSCGAGTITLLPLDRLKVELFAMHNAGPDDPHAEQGGSYLVRGVSLIASCKHYDPEGLLLWLPLDEQYGLWDGEHGNLFVFGPEVTWSVMASDLPRHLNAHWGGDGCATVTDLAAWKRHPYNPEQCWKLPDLEEWYEAKWLRRGLFREGFQLRYPEEIRIRVERTGERPQICWQVKKPQEAASWSTEVTRVLSPHEWQRIRTSLEEGFWAQPSSAFGGPFGETETIWSIDGFRAQRFHRLFRSYAENGAGGEPVHELGKSLAGLCPECAHVFESVGSDGS